MVAGHEVYDEEEVRIEARGDAEGRHEPRERFRHAFLCRQARRNEAHAAGGGVDLLRFSVSLRLRQPADWPACTSRQP